MKETTIMTLFALAPAKRAWTPSQTDALRAIAEDPTVTSATEVLRRYRVATGDRVHTVAAIYTEIGDLKRVLPDLPLDIRVLKQFSLIRRQEEGKEAKVAPVMVAEPGRAPEGFLTQEDVVDYQRVFDKRIAVPGVLALLPDGSTMTLYAIQDVEKALAA